VSIVPAAGLGLLVVFLIGAGLTYFILDGIEKKRKRHQTLYKNTLREVSPGFLTENRIEKLSLAGGGISVVLFFILLALLPLKNAILVEIGLVVAGIVFGLGTFYLFGKASADRQRNMNRSEKSSKPGVIDGRFVDQGGKQAAGHKSPDAPRKSRRP
jgi:hypothetical protein